MAKKKTVLKWWWGWNVAKIERWLESQEALGWNLVRAGGSGLLFTFVKGEPRQVAYRVDYQTKVEDDYAQIFEDAGWSLAGSGAGWYYWQQEFTQVKPEIYTDVESLIGRNRRQMRLLGILLTVQVITMNTVFSRAHDPFTGGLAVLQFTLIMLMVFAVFKFIMANRRLRSKL